MPWGRGGLRGKRLPGCSVKSLHPVSAARLGQSPPAVRKRNTVMAENVFSWRESYLNQLRKPKIKNLPPPQKKKTTNPSLHRSRKAPRRTKSRPGQFHQQENPHGHGHGRTVLTQHLRAARGGHRPGHAAVPGRPHLPPGTRGRGSLDAVTPSLTAVPRGQSCLCDGMAGKGS